MTHPLDPERRSPSGGALPNVDPGAADSPFGRGRHSRVTRVTGVVGLAAALIGAAVLAWLATRGPTPAASVPPEPTHVAGADAAARPVMLTGEDARRIGVTYAAAVLGTLETEVRTVAQVTYDETRVRTIAPKLEGWVDALFVNYTGQPVRQGDPLLAIYSPMLVAAQQELLLAARLERDVAGGSAESRRNAAELRAAARGRLLAWDIPVPDIDRIERTGAAERAIVLRAPVSGVVLEKNVLAGQKIMAGDALYRVADLQVVWVEGEVFERDLPTVRLGQTATAEFQALPGRSRTGRIAYVYPTINPETRTARVRVTMPNGDLALKPGMYATLRLTGTSDAPVLSVPRSAVLSTGERNLVFVKRADGMLEPREVRLGVANDERVHVLHGLVAGDTVVASATFLVDAESNLGSQLGGMGDMPGMDMTAPKKPAPRVPAAPGRGRR